MLTNSLKICFKKAFSPSTLSKKVVVSKCRLTPLLIIKRKWKRTVFWLELLGFWWMIYWNAFKINPTGFLMIISREISIIFLSGSDMEWHFHYKLSRFYFLKISSLSFKLLLVNYNYYRSDPDCNISNSAEWQKYYVQNVLEIWFLKHHYKWIYIYTFIYLRFSSVSTPGKNFSLARSDYFLKCQPFAVRQNDVYSSCSLDVNPLWHRKKEMCLSKSF